MGKRKEKIPAIQIYCDLLVKVQRKIETIAGVFGTKCVTQQEHQIVAPQQ